MTNKINGAVNAGEFLTGNMDFFTVATVVPCYPTNVTTPVVDLLGYQTYVNTGVWTNVTVIDGTGAPVTYTSLAGAGGFGYLDAFYKQLNLNNLIAAFSQRANPVAVSVNTLSGDIPGTSTDLNFYTNTLFFAYYGLWNNLGTPSHIMGSAYTTDKTAYVVKFATEHNLLWTAGTVDNFATGSATDGSNAKGYLFLDALNGVIAYDLQSSDRFLNASSQSSITAINSPYATTNTAAPYVTTWNSSDATKCNTLAGQGYYLGVAGL